MGTKATNPSKPIRQLVYISRPETMRDEQGLIQLFQQSFNDNDEMHVTGVLLCGDDFYVQCIEGDDLVIRELYRRIEFDSRHRDVIKLIDLRSSGRSFDGWNMAVTWDTAHEQLNGMTRLWDEQRKQRDASLTNSAAWVLIRSMWLTYGIGGIRLPQSLDAS